MSQVELTPEELFEKCNFEEKDQIISLFPSYVREQYAVQGKKNISKAVNIELYTMKTPYGDKTLLKDTPLVLEAGRKQCLYGNNGAGKTLLFEYMSQHKIKDLPKHIHIHHCKELENHELSDTVLGTVVNSHAFRNILLKVETKLEALIAAGEGDVAKLKENLGWVQFSLTNISARDAEDRASKMLRVLGFDEHGQKKLVSELSGGLRMRVALCIAFFVDCDLLLLDEPTNHLDFPSVLWLENRLRGFRGSFLLVTHDRELLNNVCHSVIYIDMEQKQLIYYPCGFKEFEKRKATDEKKKFDEIEKFLKKNQKTDPSTMLGRQVADKRAWSQAYFERQVAMQGKFTFPTSVKLDNIEDVPNPDDISLINLQNVRFSYNPALENPVFIFNTPISFNVKATTRVGVMGPNGAGKSTLLKLLTKKLVPTEGKVTQHPHFTLAYFGQHSTAELIMEETPIEFMTAQFPRANGGQLRGHLAKTGISGPVAETRMANLSYSQRSCVIFAKLTFVCPHLLIMDEPTNFLDLESVDSLISACNKYKGALLLVSHNRDFLRKCAKQYLSVVPGHFELYDDMKTAERATYTFIAEMEEGGGLVGKSALANNPGGGTVHASQKVGETKEGEAAPAAGAAKPAAASAAPAVTFTVGEKVTALWTDKKWYPAEIKAVLPANKYTVLYTQYGNTANVPAAGIKKGSAAAAPAAKPAAAAAKPAAAAAGKGAPAKGAPAKGGRK